MRDGTGSLGGHLVDRSLHRLACGPCWGALRKAAMACDFTDPNGRIDHKEPKPTTAFRIPYFPTCPRHGMGPAAVAAAHSLRMGEGGGEGVLKAAVGNRRGHSGALADDPVGQSLQERQSGP